MNTWYSRPVFFVTDPARSIAFYVDQLGFKQDWAHEHDGELIVAQVSRGDFELILNKDAARVGKGRIYFHLHDEQITSLREEFTAKGLAMRDVRWGEPKTEVLDPDGNELLFDKLSVGEID